MTTKELFSGNGKSYSFVCEEGMHRSDRTRCIADEGKALTLYDSEPFYCRDILNEEVEDIVEIDDPTPPEPPEPEE